MLGFKYFTFLCGLVVQSDEVLLSGASALVTRLDLLDQLLPDALWHVSTSFFTENKNPKLVLLHSLTFRSAQKILFSGCLLVSVDIMLYTILTLLKDVIGQPIVSEDEVNTLGNQFLSLLIFIFDFF